MNDRRFINPSIGSLTGEASQQKTKANVVETLEAPSQLVPTEYHGAAEGPTYFDQPVLQKPVWIWSVPAYFYVGGTAGAALVLGWAAQRADRAGLSDLIRRCRWIGTLGLGLGGVFLILDLGKPLRFLHMLRVFRPSSPLSVGSWLLALGGPMAGGAAVLADSSGLLRGLGDLAGGLGALIGMPLAGYTGVVLADTAVPAWQEARRALPVAFIGSAMAGTASMLELMPLNRQEYRVVRRFGIAAKAAELAGTLAIEREASGVERVGRPFRQGRAGALWKAAKVLSAASLLTSLVPLRSRRKHIAAGLLGSAGALCLRFAALEVGKASAADPRATFQQHRQGRGGLEVTGVRAVAEPPVPPRIPVLEGAAPPRTMTGRPE